MLDILIEVAPVLLSHIPKEALFIGGGTALAAQWKHQRSTDIDFFVSKALFQKLSTKKNLLFADTLIQDLQYGRGWLAGKA
ncbi:MAG: hypothetical protein OXC62_05685 [Aestuariivita sp.]|nr:hypothetical protein [Aestuariivita sp.]